MTTYVKGDKVANATSYKLFEGDTEIAEASEINFNVSELIKAEGEHTLHVKAYADGYSPSDASNTVKYTVSASGSTGDTEGDVDDTGGNTDPEIGTSTTFGSSGTSVTIIDDFADFDFVDGAVVSTSGGSSCNFGTGTARATSNTQVLKIAGGETFNFNAVISGLTWALVEFTATPCTTSTFNTKGELAKAWLSGNVTAHADTRYIVVNFNRGSGSFTADELALLKTAITLS